MKLHDYLNQDRNTQVELAKALGVSQGLVGHWVNGRRRITAERAIEIETATGGAVSRADLRPDLFGSTEDAA